MADEGRTKVSLLEIKNLQVKVDDREILKGLDLTVNKGEVHAIMGPNGSGKSTLAHVLSGKPGYEVTGGSVTFEGVDLLALSPDQRAATRTNKNACLIRVSRGALLRQLADVAGLHLEYRNLLGL